MTDTTDTPSFDSFTAFRAAQCDYYRSLHDEPGYRGAAARLALTMRFQAFEWLDGEIRRHTRPDFVIDALAQIFATSAVEITQSVRHTCKAQAGIEPPPAEFWAAMFMRGFEELYMENMAEEGFVLEVKGNKPLRES